ncbi:MAG: penicillin-binding protein 2 [Candidatus Moraniibacteriota bacterium]|nr:MAG: penicillin-binding protein 2 [Candidatus Moranbacteria bacterium]
MAGRLFVLQILRSDEYGAAAEEQRTVTKVLPSNRGEIFLRDAGGLSPVAVNRRYSLVYAVPPHIGEGKETARRLSEIVGVPEATLEEKFSKTNDPFEVVKRRVSDEEAERIRALALPGIGLLPEVYRYYPADELLSQTLGFVGMKEDESVGQYGVEASFEEVLRGSGGAVSNERDAAGRWIPLAGRTFEAPIHGANIVLTVERVLQYEVEKILREAVNEFHADGGTIVVLEPKTGSIRALASLPNFNPNEYAKAENVEAFLNPAVSLTYEPGSIMKPITMAIGIEEGKVHAGTEYVDTGVVKEGGYAIRNAEEKVYGRVTMMKVLEESINTGVIFVERSVGNSRFRNYLERFGFGQETGVRLPAEASGNMQNLKNTNRSIEFFTASFGQGITVTPLQIANAYAALANRGILMKPRIVERLLFSDGRSEEVPPEEIRSVVSESTAREIGGMLRNVVVNGHGKRADVPGYSVVGKTGTAQVAKRGEKGYEEGMNIGSFVGYAPLENPEFVVLVKIDNPKDVVWAESSAAPTFGKVMKFLLESSGIPRTESERKG